MKRQTYNLDSERESLIYEESYDSNNNLIHYIDLQAKPISEKKFEYNNNNQLIKEIEISDGIELQRLEMLYDEKGEVIEQNLLFSGNLYESVKTEFKIDGFVRTTYQDEEEVYRVENTTENKNYINKYFDYGNLSNIQSNKFNEDNLLSENLIYDAENNLLIKRVEELDKEGKLTTYKEFNADNQLINRLEYERVDNKIVKEIKSNFVKDEIDNVVSYDYDENGNLIKTETRTNSGKLVEFHTYVYDDKNRMIEESGVSNGKFNAIYGTYIDSNQYKFGHKYLD